jgi:hypothetical protein
MSAASKTMRASLCKSSRAFEAVTAASASSEFTTRDAARQRPRANIGSSDLLASFSVDGKAPRTVIITTVDEIYFQCARAIVRSDLWNADKRVDPKSLPTPARS